MLGRSHRFLLQQQVLYHDAANRGAIALLLINNVNAAQGRKNACRRRDMMHGRIDECRSLPIKI